MNRLALVLMAGLVSLGLAVILVFWRVQTPGHRETERAMVPVGEAHPRVVESRGPTEKTGSAALWRQVISLSQQVETLTEEVARLAQANTTGPLRQKPARLGPEKGDDEEDVTSKHTSMVAKVAEGFLKEVRDPSRASGKESRIREPSERSASLRHAIQSVDCRSVTCRVEMVDDAAANLGETMSLFISDLSESLPLLTTDWVKAPDGTGRYVLYMGGS